MSNRTVQAQVVEGLDGATQNLNIIKQLLNNGHVLTIGTCIGSWVTKSVKADRANANNPHAGELAVAWQNGYEDPHCMTIVGYDDNVWIDVNDNGVVDPGEKGAFLVANSWGKQWGNKGFVWVAYDAFLSHSAVVNGPEDNRTPFAASTHSKAFSAVAVEAQSSPKLFAQFSLSNTTRNQIYALIGVSDCNSAKPSKTHDIIALKNQGGAYGFDGNVAEGNQTAEFSFDLTDLLPEEAGASQRYYLIVKDGSEGGPLTLEGFNLVDLVNHTTTACSTTPITFENTKVMPYIDYALAVAESSEPVKAPNIAIHTPAMHQAVEGQIWVTAGLDQSDGVAAVEFYIDGKRHSSDRSPPYYVLLNTNDLRKGKHTISAVAKDASDQQMGSSSVDVFVSKPRPSKEKRNTR